MSTEAIDICTTRGRIAALGWRCADGPRTLCLHGWLDNAASFLPLARHLPELDLVAVDLPGHGHSEHRHATARYHFVEYLFDVDAVLDELGWTDCHLLGHSMGAAISAVYAAGAPERVRSVVLLDALGPISAAPDRTAERLRRSLLKNRRGVRETRSFESIDAMIQARRSVSDLSEEAARLICERAARAGQDGFTWRSDPALNWVSPILMSDEQALDLLRHIEAPVLALTVTTDSPWASAEQLETRRHALSNAQHLRMHGHHHFHMDAPAEIAETVQEFIIGHDQPKAKRTT
jgi:pimeloyl-ACP methyl ester carboxylesterase